MKKVIYPLINTVSLLVVLLINYWSNTGQYNGKTVGSVSNQYDSLFTPAGYTFSIWGFIYLFLIAFVVYQWYSWKTGNGLLVEKASWWLVMANLLNSLWVIVWLNERTGISVMIMFGILISLTMLVVKIGIDSREASKSVIAFVWWPVLWYFGWIILATVANVSSYLVAIDWNWIFDEVSWTVIMIGISTFIYAWLLEKKNLREPALIGIWGLIGISAKQWETQVLVSSFALIGVLVLALVISTHAYRTWKKSLVM